MAQSNDRRRYGYTDGSLAYDLDALARERALDDAGRMEPPAPGAGGGPPDGRASPILRQSSPRWFWPARRC